MMASSANNGGFQKLRFAAWLIDQINSENYEGLRWVDNYNTMFRIPWKHTNRKDITANDYNIFKAWAIASGKYNEKLKDPAKWKTNFRCALRSTNMFSMEEDNSKASDDPHKVYKVIRFNAMATANVPAAARKDAGDTKLHDSKDDVSPQTKDAPAMKHPTLQLLQVPEHGMEGAGEVQQIELDFQILSLKNPSQKMDSVQNEIPASDLGRNQPSGYATSNSAPNGYQGSTDTLRWVMEQCNFTQASQQQLLWALDEGLDHSAETRSMLAMRNQGPALTAQPHTACYSQMDQPLGEVPYEDSQGYPNNHIGQNGYPHQGSGMANGPVENYHQTTDPWVIQTMAEPQPMQNAYDPSAALLLQQPLPHSTVPVISQLLNNAVEVHFEGTPHYNNHTGVQSTFLNDTPAGNAVTYPMLNGPGENCYPLLANQWAAPAMAEQNGFAHPAAPLPEQHPSPNTGPSRNNTETIPPNLDVTIYYRGQSFHKVQVTTSSCLFTYNNKDPSFASDCTQVVNFPSPDELPDQKQLQFTRQLLQTTGLLLEQKHKKIYAKRLNKCKVFWAHSKQLVNMAQNAEPKQVPRGTETEIFDYEEFCKELKDFREHQRPGSPDFTIYLCFGQYFSKSRPKEALLVLVKLVPKFCEYFHDMVLREGTSSLNSGNLSLQMSNSFSLFDCIEQFNMQFD